MSETDSAGVAEITPVPGTRLIDKAVAHYNAQDRQEIDVPEWGTKIYSRPMTFDDSAKAMKMRGKDPKRWYPAVVVAMAEDEKGEKLFHFTELDRLVSNTDMRVLARIGIQITGDQVGAETHKGN